jgi:hypothetical protein
MLLHGWTVVASVIDFALAVQSNTVRGNVKQFSQLYSSLPQAKQKRLNFRHPRQEPHSETGISKRLIPPQTESNPFNLKWKYENVCDVDLLFQSKATLE